MLKNVWAALEQLQIAAFRGFCNGRQHAGFQIGELEVELGVTPKITVDVKIGQTISEDKLKAVLLANPNNVLLSVTLNALLQASKLQKTVSVETLELKDVKIAMTTTPTVALQWKEKAIAKTVAA